MLEIISVQRRTQGKGIIVEGKQTKKALEQQSQNAPLHGGQTPSCLPTAMPSEQRRHISFEQLEHRSVPGVHNLEFVTHF
jgi:hypothetical protein